MFTYGIRNIVHKHAVEDISILYYPANDLIDDIITDWDANFFIYIDLLNNKINKNNVAYINDASLIEYDFILCYNITSDILDISTKLHIPIITYLRYGSYDDSKIPDQKNIYYIVEHHGQSEQEKLLAITPTINKNVINNDNNICLFINNSNDYGNLIQVLSSKIKNLSIVDEQKINQNAMLEILNKHKICIDLYPQSIYKMLFCATNNLPYITISNEMTNKYTKIYDGVFFMEQNLDGLLDLFNRLLASNVSYKNNLSKQNIFKDQLLPFIQKIKRKGMIL